MQVQRFQQFQQSCHMQRRATLAGCTNSTLGLEARLTVVDAAWEGSQRHGHGYQSFLVLVSVVPGGSSCLKLPASHDVHAFT